MSRITFFIASLLISSMAAIACKTKSFNESNLFKSKKPRNETPNAAADVFFRSVADTNANKKVVSTGATHPLSYGFEFEGMSPKVWKYFGLKKDAFENYILNFPDTQRLPFLRWFFVTLINEEHIIWTVTEPSKSSEISQDNFPKSTQYLTLPLTNLDKLFLKFVKQAGETPMSHMDWDTRTKLINNYALK
jgi:hypothetical protein